MSRVTSQERQSIAKNLRYLASCYTPEGGLERFRATLEDELFTGPGHASYTEIFACLADLIDPTCKNKQVETNKMAPFEFKADNFICSNCGETFCADKEGINAPIDWSYCPNCGARVVNGVPNEEA